MRVVLEVRALTAVAENLEPRVAAAELRRTPTGASRKTTKRWTCTVEIVINLVQLDA